MRHITIIAICLLAFGCANNNDSVRAELDSLKALHNQQVQRLERVKRMLDEQEKCLGHSDAPSIKL